MANSRTVIKTILKYGALIGIGALLGYGWFRFGAVFSPAFVPEYSSSAPSVTRLPALPKAFGGTIGPSYRQSSPDYPPLPRAGADAPNILLILTDDVGFASSSTFGGPVPTPELDRLASSGLIYNRFHTTAMCSPTRAAMLTGRNAHMVGSGMISNLATGYPGYTSVIPKSAATIGRILTGNGYNTAFFGKHHNVPDEHSSAAGPFDLWPTGLGFEYFYGFIGGDTNQFHPKLFRGVQAAGRVDRDPGFILDRELADDAIRWLRNQSAAAPDKPWMIWFAPGTAHAPHQAPREWIEKFRGKFDQGWDVIREESFARQKANGLVPAGTVLTPRPGALPPWDSLSTAQRRIAARYMEVFAATLAFQDQQIGRLIEELRDSGDFENTLLMFVQGDNGGSAEGGLAGHLNEIGEMANRTNEPEDWVLERLETMGGPDSYQNYPAAWGWAMNTPFQWTKTVASHLGGVRNGLVVSWPREIRQAGQVRGQFHHVIDVLPTLLEATGIAAPESVDGILQQRIDGISMLESFNQPDAPGRLTQYFELYANRAIYHDGWLANTRPAVLPWNQEYAGGNPLTDYAWELYDLESDFSQAHDLAATHADRLAELQARFWTQAENNNVLPLDDRRGAARAWERFMRNWRSSNEAVFRGSEVSVAWAAAPQLFARDFSVFADITPDSSANGVILAVGSWFGGWSFFLDQGRPVARHVFSQREEDGFTIRSDTGLENNRQELEFRFEYEGGGLGQGGTLTILRDEEILAQGWIERTITVPAGLGETMDTGRDTGVPVARIAAGQSGFEGSIHQVRIRTGRMQMLSF